MRLFSSEWPRRFRSYWDRLSEGERALHRFLAVLLALTMIAPAAYFGLQPLWQRWRHRQALNQAERFAGQQDHRNALLAYQRATQIAPSDLATWRAAADYLSRHAFKEALVARENVVHLAPGDMVARLALATEALRFGQPDRARDALAGTENLSPGAEHHRLAAAIAQVDGDLEALELHLVALLGRRPEDPEARFNLAVLRLWNPDTTPAARTQALATLDALIAVREVRVRAALELLKHAARQRDAARAGVVIQTILTRLPAVAAEASSTATEPPEWSALLRSLQQAATDGAPADVALLTRWLGDIRRRPHALAWLETLPAELRESPPVRDVAAELAAEADDRGRLVRVLQAGAWGPVPDDAVTLALAARVQRLRQQSRRSVETWREAIEACGGSATGLQALGRLALAWRDDEALEAALQALLKAHPRHTWAFAALQRHYRLRGETEKLWSLLTERVRRAPDDHSAVSAWVQLSAVLDRASDPAAESPAAASKRLATQARADLSLNAQVAVLWRGQRYDEALAQLTTVAGTSGRVRGEVAYWFTVVSAELGRPVPDRIWRAARALPLLEPESALLRAAAEKLGQRTALTLSGKTT